VVGGGGGGWWRRRWFEGRRRERCGGEGQRGGIEVDRGRGGKFEKRKNSLARLRRSSLSIALTQSLPLARSPGLLRPSLSPAPFEALQR